MPDCALTFIDKSFHLCGTGFWVGLSIMNRGIMNNIEVSLSIWSCVSSYASEADSLQIKTDLLIDWFPHIFLAIMTFCWQLQSFDLWNICRTDFQASVPNHLHMFSVEYLGLWGFSNVVTNLYGSDSLGLSYKMNSALCVFKSYEHDFTVTLLLQTYWSQGLILNLSISFRFLYKTAQECPINCPRGPKTFK